MKATNKSRIGGAQQAHKPSGNGLHGIDDEWDEPIGEVFDAINLRDRVVIKLLFDQVVRIEQVEAAWYRWRQKQQRGQADELWRVLAEDPDLDREAVFSEASTIYAFKKFNVPKSSVLDFINRKGERFSNEQWERLAHLCVLPAASLPDEETGELQWIFITHDPLRSEINQYLRSLGFKRFEVCYSSEALIREILKETVQARNEFLERINEDEIAFDLGLSIDQQRHEMVDEDALQAEISRSKLINLFEAMLVEAVRKGVSDIHLFPNGRREIEIHFRIDGDLELWHVEDRVHPEAFLAVVKDNVTNVDRFERDAAQDGFIQRRVDDAVIRFRVSILPLATSAQELRSESIVIRVLDDRKVILDLRKIGLHQVAFDRFQHAIRQPYGMVILTGPTGSGKTTTLYASLQQVVSPKRNVLTVEDPVEYILPGVRQIKLNQKLDLEGALRAILRHDPDIVMVGEMRDRQTAELAIKLANTGHLTFSTLHTNDAPSAVSRLYKMGIEPFLIAYAINLVVAQRLIRRLCPDCKKPVATNDTLLMERLGFTPEEIDALVLYTSGQDPRCRTCKGQGYKGRRAITETLLFSPEIRQQIVMADDLINEDELRQTAVKQGMMSLQDSALALVREGETSLEEMMRVVFTEM